jgi:hypothetical protein
MEVMSISCGGYHNGHAAGLPPGGSAAYRKP